MSRRAATTSPVAIPIRSSNGRDSPQAANRGQRLLHFQGAEARTQSVVVVGDRHAEDGQHRVPDELLERPAESDDGFRHDLERAVDSGADFFGVQLVDQPRVADQIRKQRRDDAAVARLQAVERAVEPGAAEMAETRTGAGGRGTFGAEHRDLLRDGGGDVTPCDEPAKLFRRELRPDPSGLRRRQDRLFACRLDADLARDGPRDMAPEPSRPALLALGHGRNAHVRALPKSDVERDPAQEVEAVLGGEALSAAAAEEVGHLAAMGTDEARHVLDQAEDRHAHPPEHGQSLGHVGQGDLLRRRHQDGAGERHGLGESQLRVGGAGRQVHDQVVEVAPFHVAQELLDRAADERSAPHDRLALGQEELDRDDLDAVGLDRGDLAAGARHRLPFGADHHRNVRAGDVGI